MRMLCLWTVVSNEMRPRFMLTQVRGLLEPGIGNEADRSVEPLRMLEDIQRQRNFLAPQLRLDPLQRVLHAQPEVDLLRGGSGSDIARQLRDRLDLLDPRVDIGLQLVEKCWIGEERLRLDGIDRYSAARGVTLVCWFSTCQQALWSSPVQLPCG